MNPKDPRWKTADENNPVLVKMDRDCKAALVSVKAALKAFKTSTAAKGKPGSVGVEAVKSLLLAAKALEEISGPESPFVWEIIDLDGK